MEDFSDPIYTNKDGVEFRIRHSTESIFTHHPRTDEWVYICKLENWPEVAKKFGLRVVKKKRRSNGNK